MHDLLLIVLLFSACTLYILLYCLQAQAEHEAAKDREKVELKQKEREFQFKNVGPNNEVHVSPPRKKWVEPSSLECPILEGEHKHNV